MAPQSAKGVTAATPEFFLKAIGGALSPKRTTGQTLTGDGTVFSNGFEYVESMTAGGSLQVAAQPLGMGALVNAIFGTDTKSGVSDPYTHDLVPNQASGGTDWYTFWKRVDDYWELYPDCRVSELLIEASVDRKLMQLTATILGAGAVQYISAPSSATAESDAFKYNDACGTWCQDGTPPNIITHAKPTDLASLITFLTAYKTGYEAHRANTTNSAWHHKASDAVNTLSYATPCADLAACQTALGEILTDFEAHRVNVSAHYFTDTLHDLQYTAPTGLPACLVAAAEAKDMYNKHAGYIGSVREFSLRVTRGFEVWNGACITPYDVVEGHGEIEASFTVLLDNEGLRFYKKLMYGTPEPATSAEVVSSILSGSLYSKFTAVAASPGPERSVAVTIPTLQYTADDIGDAVAGDPAGAAGAMTINGYARGTDPKCTITVLNSRSSAY